jgi:hypothetical protein
LVPGKKARKNPKPDAKKTITILHPLICSNTDVPKMMQKRLGLSRNTVWCSKWLRYFWAG